MNARACFEQYSGRNSPTWSSKAMASARDGRTLIGQPHVRGDKLWTVEDLKRAIACSRIRMFGNL